MFTVVVALLIYGYYFLINNVTPYAIIKPLHFPVNPKTNDLPAKLGLNHSVLNIKTKDSINIKAWYIPAKRSSNITLILLHGINADKSQNLGFAKLLSDNNINCLLPDMRAHGESTGNYCTYGFYEKYDVLTIIDYIIKFRGENEIIGIWGTSLGGAIALQTMAIDKRIKFGIIESTFASLKEIVEDYTLQYAHINLNFLADASLIKAEQIGKFDASKVKPEISALYATQLILYIHGDNDKKINIKYGYRIFKNLKSTDKTFYVVKGGGHYNTPATGGDEYRQKILGFIKKF